MVTAVILTKNEEENIVDCLLSLSFCDEIIVVDDESTDRTVSLAKNNGATVHNHPLEKDFAGQRNFGLKNAKHEWVLFVDADERISKELASEIECKTSQDNLVDGFLLKRTDVMWGKILQHGETSLVKLLRLGRRGKGRWHHRVHETWEIDGNISTLKFPILHMPHPNISEFLAEVNFYSTLRAQELYVQRARTSLFWIVAYPTAKFIQNYFLRRGFLDGNRGFIMALMMSLHSFLVRGKLYFHDKHETRN